MSRGEKIVATVFGLLVFTGLFFFIYSSMKAAPAGFPEDAAIEDFGDEGDFNLESDAGPVEDLSPVEEPAAPAPKPEKKQAKK